MSFKTNLGRVRGERGVSYVPKIVPQTENGVIKKYNNDKKLVRKQELNI